MKHLLITLLLFTFFISSNVYAQLSFSGEFRPRAQYRHGWRNLPEKDQDPAVFIGQRTRLNLGYKQSDLVTFKVSLQDVRVWGDQSQLVDEANIGVFEAWADLKVANRLRFKLGRQELNYDDGYLLGTLNWREAGRSHDIGILKFQDSTFSAHLAYAYNQNKSTEANTIYTNNYYKSMQYLWLNKELGKAKISLIFLNRGLQKGDTTVKYSQTIGTNTKIKFGKKLNLTGIYYHQLGKDTLNRKVDAYMASLKLKYDLTRKTKITIGTDILSGTDASDLGGNTNNTFDILYGFRHRHFGNMDYFYLGYTPVSGLRDIMLKFEHKVSDKVKANLDFHGFYGNADIINPSSIDGEIMDSKLGNEIDFTLTYKPSDLIKVRGGYSQMFGTETLEVIKGKGDRDAFANWAWFEISVTPNFLN